MPFGNDGKGIHGPTVWRAVIVGLAIVLALVVIGVVALYKANRSAIDANRDLACRIGAFFVGQPIVKQPKQTEKDFEETVHKAVSFLRALKAQDCTQVRGASISIQEINRALHKLHEAVKGGGASGGGSPPGQPGGSPPPEPPGSSPQPDCTIEINRLGQHICVDVP